MTAVLSGFEQSVVDAATKHDDNWEAVAFEVDRDPELVQEVARAARAKLAGSNGTAATAAPVRAATTLRRACADHECSITFDATSNAQKYCKDKTCTRRRWARDKRAQTGHKTKPAKAAPKPATPPASVRQEVPAGDLASRYVGLLLDRALDGLTPEQARAELERLAGLAA